MGPKVQPYFYDGDLFVVSDDGKDHQRTAAGKALIGDPRNDENLIISQLHLAVLKFHNIVRKCFASSFEEAQTIVRWHYQWIVLNEFLRLTCGDEAVDGALAQVPPGTTFASEAFMPVEFAVAAYRFGHTQVRAGYRINSDFARLIFPADANDPPPTKDLRLDLRGGPVGAAFAVDWSFFFGDGEGRQLSNKIDTKLAGALLNLPMSVVDDASLANQAPNRSLAVRNLKRGISFELPSGEAIAGFLGIEALTPEEVGDHSGMSDGTPLWFYVLKEAEMLADGEHLAGVGARLVAEVFVELLRMDTASFLSRDPAWTPTLPSQTPGSFTMSDLVVLAGRSGCED